MTNNSPYEKKTYILLALDPIHVGTGGYRLGRVDMSIVREPGTNLPKIPGTSLAGACRTYAAMSLLEQGKFPHCAGQGQPDEKGTYKGHCGRDDCPICVTFGFSRGEQGSFQGLAQFSDARQVFFPAYSLAGPVWITCRDVLSYVIKDLSLESPPDEEVLVAKGVKVKDYLNLGWLMLKAKPGFSINGEELPAVPSEILERAVLVSNKMFSQIVNDNLEVRTSVSIDPNTGAASEGALYTYEALPRVSVLVFDVVLSDPKYYKINGRIPLESGGRDKIKMTLESGLRLFETLGVGGMNTRGMGRLKALNLQDGQAQGGVS